MITLMSWYTIFYVMSIADKFNAIILTLAIIFGITSVGIQIFNWLTIADDETLDPRNISMKKWFFFISLIFFSCYALIPSKKDLILIVVGGTIFEYVEKDSSLQQIPYELSSFMKEQIVQWKTELKKEQIEDKFENMTREELIQYLKTHEQ